MDASKIAVGGTLMQDHGEGLRPIAFMSRTLNPSERKYSAYEHELLAIAFCFVKWRHYLEGCLGGVKLVTDHKTLMSLMSQEIFLPRGKVNLPRFYPPFYPDAVYPPERGKNGVKSAIRVKAG